MTEPEENAKDPRKDTESLLNEAMDLHQRGELDAAGTLYAAVLDREPNHFTATHLLGVLRHQQGDSSAAVVLLQRALMLSPRSALAHFNLGLALWNLDRMEEALRHYQYSLLFKPDQPDALFNCALALQFLQRPEEALAFWDKALALNPEAPTALLNRGIVLQDLQRSEEALACFDRALDRDAHLTEILLSRAEKLDQTSRHEEALDTLDRILIVRPDWVDALVERSSVLLKLQRSLEALEACDAALSLQQDCAPALLNRGNALQNLHRPSEALASLDLALILQPRSLPALVTRTALLVGLKRLTEALDTCDRALALYPDCVEALLNRGTVLIDLKRPEEALEAYERALALKPDWVNLVMNHGTALHQLGRHKEALASYERALSLDPNHILAHSSKIGLMDFLPEMGLPEHQQERRQFFQTHAQRFEFQEAPPANDRNPDRRLILGYVSADFKNHATASIFLPILQRHSKADFQINCYSAVLAEDEWTHRCQACAEVWRRTTGMSDEAMAAQIRSDGVDILIDLSGHTAGNRLLVFARKPAPIQVSGWGHGGGTGLPMMDYLFADPMAIPPAVRPLFAEEIYDLPCHISFEAPAFTPPVADPPVAARGYLTFGCLNRYTKVTADVERLWARILAGVPDSRLMLKDALFGEARFRMSVLEAFAKLGISQDRILFRGSTSRRDHLAAYSDADITLDPFPLNGGMTTWESLWMGAPVIAKLGNTLGSRASGAILHALGLGDWVAEDEDEYVDVAIRKAADLAALAQFRLDIRSRILASPAGNPELYTGAVEAAYRAMWKKWVAQQTFR